MHTRAAQQHQPKTLPKALGMGILTAALTLICLVCSLRDISYLATRSHSSLSAVKKCIKFSLSAQSCWCSNSRCPVKSKHSVALTSPWGWLAPWLSVSLKGARDRRSSGVGRQLIEPNTELVTWKEWVVMLRWKQTSSSTLDRLLHLLITFLTDKNNWFPAWTIGI